MSSAPLQNFPNRPNNRPALPRIDYRIGGYTQIRDAIWDVLNTAPALRQWTHRASDDPGVALVEVAAVIGDILTFYQEHYANEAFLRTAAWSDSIRELVRLTGYRLGAATAGRVAFAFTVKGDRPVAIPASFPVKAELETGDQPVDFLTTAAFTAEPHFNDFRLYRKRVIEYTLAANVTRFEIASIGASAHPDTKAAFDLKAGDQLMIIPNEPAWLLNQSTIGPNPSARQIVKVKAVTRTLDRLSVEIEHPIRHARSGTIRAYRIGRSFRHFGFNTPAKYHTAQTSGAEITGTYEYDTDFTRHWHHSCKQFSGPEELPRNVIPTDREVNDLQIGSTVIIEAPIYFGSSERAIVLAREITAIESTPFSIGDISGTTTRVSLNQNIAGNRSAGNPYSDLRFVRMHETTSAELRLIGASDFDHGEFTDTNQLYFYGDSAAAQVLNERQLMFKADDGRYAAARVTQVAGGGSQPTMRRVTLDRIPAGFSRDDFDEVLPTVSVYGNIVDATQGKLEQIATLGNGDMRQTFQTFKLPKAPLTHLHDSSATPPAQPELIVRVDGRAWQRVDVLFDHGPKDEIYILREDDAGAAWVQFGDGKTGARLPSGIQNISAEYRTGVGAIGPLKHGKKPTSGGSLKALDTIYLPGEVTGGAARESGDNARLNAPPKLQSLGRLVSLADYESEARSLPGVVTAKAAWEIADGSPAIQIRMLLQQVQQSDVQFQAAAESIRAADKARGMLRYPIEVVQCELRYLFLTVQYAYDQRLIQDDVESRIQAALGLVDDQSTHRTGLFGLYNRALGQHEYRHDVEGAIQNVDGVDWCRVTQFGLLAAGDDPLALSLPYSPGKAWRVTCTPTELLQLHASHLSLNPIDS